MKKNKIVTIFIVIALLINIHIQVIAATTGVVNNDTVRVREDATTDSDIVGLVSIGDKVTITGEKDNWYKVKAKGDDGDDIIGYIRKDLLTVDDSENVPTSPSEDKPSENKPDTENPSENKPDVETPSENEPDAENPSEDVPNVDTPDDNNTIEIQENSTEITTIKVTSRLSVGTKINLTEETKIKILPLANSTNIATLQPNTEATVLEVINNWCRIETEGECGWVRIDQ